MLVILWGNLVIHFAKKSWNPKNIFFEGFKAGDVLKAWELVKDCVIEGRPLKDRMDFHLLLRMVPGTVVFVSGFSDETNGFWQKCLNFFGGAEVWFGQKAGNSSSVRMNRSTPSLPSNMLRSSMTHGQRIALSWLSSTSPGTFVVVLCSEFLSFVDVSQSCEAIYPICSVQAD